MRDIIQIIDKIKVCVPAEEKDIISELDWYRNDFSYKAPEQMKDCWWRLVDFLNNALKKPDTDWKKQIELIMTDKENDVKKKRFKLCPELVDGDHWTVVDRQTDVIEAINNWFLEDNMAGDKFMVEVVEMSDNEVKALPEI